MSRRLAASALLALVVAGCAPLEPPSCEEEGDTACFRGVFKTLVGRPIEGMEVCAPDQPTLECVESDEGGGWKLPGLPPDTNVVLTARHPDYARTAFPQRTDMSWYAWYKVGVPTDIADSNATRLDVEARADRGSILFLAWEGLNIDGEDTRNVADVTAELRDGGGRVFYANGLGLADADATATAGTGLGGVLNVPPGTVELRLRAPAGRCADEPMFHYPADPDGWIPVPILAGWTTAIDVICPVDR